jgi:restriction endonuclease S subunit
MISTPYVHLHELADVRMGVTFRGRDATRPAPHGSCFMIRIGDITDDGHLTTGDLLQFEPEDDLKPDYFLRRGDVLLPNRGTRCTAYVYDLLLSNVLVGAQFYIVRPNEAKVRSTYLAWFLRTEKAAAHFALRRKGTLVQTVQRKDVLELELPLPPLAKQDSIIALDALAIKERQLSTELALKRASYTQRLMLHAAAQI